MQSYKIITIIIMTIDMIIISLNVGWEYDRGRARPEKSCHLSVQVIIIVMIIKIIIAMSPVQVIIIFIIIKIIILATLSTLVKILKLKFRRDFEAEVWSVFRCWCLVDLTKLNLGQDSETSFGQDFKFKDADVWSRFWS